MIRWIITILIVVTVAASGGALWWLTTNGTPVQATRAKLGPIRQYVDERGKTRLPEPVLITMPYAGQIEAIRLSEGEAVRKGEVIARVSPQDLAEEVAEARAVVERLEASLIETSDVSVEQIAKTQADLAVKSMTASVAAAEAKLLADKSRLEYAEIFLGRVQRLVPLGAETEEDLELARLAHVEKQVEYRQAVLTLESQKALQAATLLMPQLLTEYMTRKQLATNVLAKQKSEAEARLHIAQMRESRGTIVSPIDGVVLHRAIRDAQFLSGGAMLLRLGQLESLEIETDVLSSDAGRIRPGGLVEIYGPAIGDDPVPGVVEKVFPTGFTKISSLGVEQQRVTVIVRFDDGELAPLLRSKNLGVDYRVRVRMITDQKEVTLVVARSTLFRNGKGQWAMFVIRHDRVELQTVDVGLMNDRHVEILSGLDDGDAVVVAPENGLIDGARVEPIFREDD